MIVIFFISILVLNTWTVTFSVPQSDDLFTSNELCLKYLQQNRIQPTTSSGECVISCKQLSGRRQCFTNDNGCISYASYVFTNNFGRNGQYYCNILPYQSIAVQEQQSSDDTRVCNDYMRSLPSAQYSVPCRVKCSNLYAIASTQGGNEYKFLCEPQQNNFAGCVAYANYISSKSTAGGIFSCNIYNHGENFNYNREESSGSLLGIPIDDSILNNRGSSVLSAGNQVTQSLTQRFREGVKTATNLVTAPFQLLLLPFSRRNRI